MPDRALPRKAQSLCTWNAPVRSLPAVGRTQQPRSTVEVAPLSPGLLRAVNAAVTRNPLRFGAGPGRPTVSQRLDPAAALPPPGPAGSFRVIPERILFVSRPLF
jgi:hypothetical protein